MEELEKIAAEKDEQSRRDNEARAKAEAEAAAKRAAGEGGLPPLDQLLKDIEAEENALKEGSAEGKTEENAEGETKEAGDGQDGQTDGDRKEDE